MQLTQGLNLDYFKFMNKEKILETLKTKEAKMEFVSGLPFKRIIEAMTAWPEVFKILDPEGAIPDGEEAQFQWLWDGVFYDDEAARLMIGSGWLDIIKRMVRGNLIYPDGTYNEQCTNIITLLKKEK